MVMNAAALSDAWDTMAAGLNTESRGQGRARGRGQGRSSS